jgi:hypothetical protein
VNSIFKHDFRNTVLRLTAFFWLLFKIMSIDLWWSVNRSFPELPITDLLKTVPAEASDFIFVASVFLLSMVLYKPRKGILLCLLVCELFVLSLDQMRWQPAIFQFVITICLGLLNPRYFKSYFFVLLSTTYVFSGLQKLNLGFINFVWGKLILIDVLGVAPDLAFHKLVKGIGLAFPIAEILLGVMIWTRIKRLGWTLIIIMHLLLLLALGPLGGNTNAIIWPWNLLMIVFAFLFLRGDTSFLNINYFRKISFGIFFILILVLPLFSFFGMHSPYLSFGLYSGNTDYLYVYSPNTPPGNKAFETITYESKDYTSVYDWSMKELNVPMIPYIPVFKEFKRSFKEKYSREAQFLIRSYPYEFKNTLPFDESD